MQNVRNKLIINEWKTKMIIKNKGKTKLKKNTCQDNVVINRQINLLLNKTKMFKRLHRQAPTTTNACSDHRFRPKEGQIDTK